MKKIFLVLFTSLFLISCQTIYVASDYSDPTLAINVINDLNEEEYPNSVALLATYTDLTLGDEIASEVARVLKGIGVKAITFPIKTTDTEQELSSAIASSLVKIPYDTEHIMLANYLYVLDSTKQYIKRFDLNLVDIESSKKILSYKFRGENDISIHSLFDGVLETIGN